MKDKESGESKGFAFVSFRSKEFAKKAIDELHSKELKVIKMPLILHLVFGKSEMPGMVRFCETTFPCLIYTFFS